MNNLERHGNIADVATTTQYSLKNFLMIWALSQCRGGVFFLYLFFAAVDIWEAG
jgi:hypothetical protein